MRRPGYLRFRESTFMSPMYLYRRWSENPCVTPWLFYPEGSSPRVQPASCAEYQVYNLGQWITSEPSQCILGKELSRADVCKLGFHLCGRGYDWVPEVGCVRQELRT